MQYFTLASFEKDGLWIPHAKTFTVHSDLQQSFGGSETLNVNPQSTKATADELIKKVCEQKGLKQHLG